jgi:hypothetical protein
MVTKLNFSDSNNQTIHMLKNGWQQANDSIQTVAPEPLQQRKAN